MVPKTLIISNSKFSEVIKLSEIVMAIAQGSYVEVILTDKRKILISKNLHWFEQKVTEQSFFRVHKSYLINLNFVSKIYHNDFKIALLNGVSIPLSRNKKQEFWKRLEEVNMVA